MAYDTFDDFGLIADVQAPTAAYPWGAYVPPAAQIDPGSWVAATIETNIGENGMAGGTIPQQYIAGTVLDVDGLGVARKVYCYRRSDGAKVGETTSAADGTFAVHPRTLDPCVLVALPLAGEQLNCAVLDNVAPLPPP